MPTLVLGFGLMAAACMLHILFWLVLAQLMILAGSGNFLIVYKILLHQSRGTKAYYYDHLYECGLVVFEKPMCGMVWAYHEIYMNRLKTSMTL